MAFMSSMTGRHTAAHAQNTTPSRPRVTFIGVCIQKRGATTLPVHMCYIHRASQIRGLCAAQLNPAIHLCNSD